MTTEQDKQKALEALDFWMEEAPEDVKQTIRTALTTPSMGDELAEALGLAKSLIDEIEMDDFNKINEALEKYREGKKQD